MRAAQKALVARGDHAATGRAIAQRWGVTHAVVDRMGDPTSGVAIELGAAVARLHQDIADGHEDEHQVHATALRRIAAIALRGAASCDRRAAR